MVVSIAIVSELAWFLNNTSLFVKVSYQYHEVLRLPGVPTNCSWATRWMGWQLELM